MRRSLVILVLGIGLVALCVMRVQSEMQVEALALVPFAMPIWGIAILGGVILTVVGLMGLVKSIRQS